jgi:beta-glucosidase
MQDFFWGTATSSFQIEGGHNIDGRSPSIWDVFTLQKGKVRNGDDGREGIDHYHHYQSDLAYLPKLGVNSYRFSLSWSRIIPADDGAVNRDGLAYYDRILDELEKYQIAPFITLYHWDLPQYLQEKGGWLNRQTVEAFAHYVEVCVRHFNKRCRHYITLNEMQCIVNLGHRTLEHAPGVYYDEEKAVRVVHNLLLAHGRATAIIRAINPEASVGFANTSTVAVPLAKTGVNIEAARRDYFALERGRFDQVTLYSDPIFFGYYPKEYLAWYAQYLPPDYQNDMPVISQKIDFCYQNIYTGHYVGLDHKGQRYSAPYQKKNFTGVFPWLHYVPEALYYGPKFLFERYQKPIFISENGIAIVDELTRGNRIHDSMRIRYLKGYLNALLKVKQEGVPITGYFAWSLFDNFEWAWGYEPRFGLIYVDRISERRYIKDSFAFYRDYIKEH